MEYNIFRLTFNSGVHIGEGSLEDHSIRLRADTVFSALCIEALKTGGEALLETLLAYTRGGDLLFSDAFPFVDEEYFTPKPVISIKPMDDPVDSGAKKVFKKLKYIPLDMVDDYVMGEFDVKTAKYIADRISEKLGKSFVFTKAAVRIQEDTLPYHVGVFNFPDKSGLYLITRTSNEALPLLRKLMASLSYAGIGGKRSSGLGRFSVEEQPLPEDIVEKLDSEYPSYMTLSVSLPDDGELGEALEGATYSLVRRSGFVFSETYAEEPLRKKDFYVFDSGSVVRRRYSGGVYDVSNKGTHPVYRYAKPMFLGVRDE